MILPKFTRFYMTLTKLTKVSSLPFPNMLKPAVKRRSRLTIHANSVSNRAVDAWNSSPESVVQSPSLNCFKSRLNN